MTSYAHVSQYASAGVAAGRRTDVQRSVLRILEYLFVMLVIIICLEGWRMVLTRGDVEETIATMTEANRSFQLVSGTLYAIAGIYLLANFSRFIRVCRGNWALLLLLAIVVMSALWSVYPLVTARRAAALLLTTGFGAYLALRFPPEVALKLAAWACGIAAVATLVFGAVDPSLAIYQQGSADETAWRGIFGQKNSMGRAMAFGVLTFAAATFVVRPPVRLATVAGALLCGVLLYLSMSRGGWITAAAVLMAVPLFVLLQPNRFSPAVRISMVALAAAIGIVLLIGLYTYGLSLLGRDDTLSGRTRLWDIALKSGMKHFVLGAGYRSFWTEEGAADVFLQTGSLGSTLGNGHNGYLDTWLELGIVGFGAFLLVFGTAIWRVARHLTQRPDATCVWMAMILGYIFVYAWTEQILIRQSEISWVILVATLFWLTPARSKARRPAALAPADALPVATARRPGAARGVAAGLRRTGTGAANFGERRPFG
jgi:exopolysaccharide production protein ExoQ